MKMTEQEKYYKSLNEDIERKRIRESHKQQRMEEALKEQEIKNVLKLVIVLMVLGFGAWFCLTVIPEWFVDHQYDYTSSSVYDSPLLTPKMKNILNSPKEGYVIDSETGELRPMNAMEYGFKIGFEGATRE